MRFSMLFVDTTIVFDSAETICRRAPPGRHACVRAHPWLRACAGACACVRALHVRSFQT